MLENCKKWVYKFKHNLCLGEITIFFRYVILILVSIGLLNLNLLSATSLVGTGAMDFVSLISTSKSDSLGGAVSAIQSFDGAYVNPASIAHVSSTHIYSQYLDYFDDIEFKNISFIRSFSFGSIGFGYSSFDLGTHIRTTLNDKTGSSTTNVNNESALTQLFYSLKMDSLLIGFSLKHATETLDSIQSSQQSIDTGIQYIFSNNFSVGAAYNNYALSDVKYIEEESSILADFRVGFMYKPHFFDYNLMFASDFIYADLDQWAYSVGLDLRLHDYLQLRFGYQTLTDLMGVSFGVGLNLDPLIIDFSYRIEDNFSDVYRIGVGLKL